jgi:hypothetical protein
MKRIGAILALLAWASLTSAGAAPALPYKVFNSVQRVQSTVFEDRNYHHAATVAEFNGRIYVAWNGNLYNSTEGQPGQVIMLRGSDDGGRSWSDLKIPFVREYRALDESLGKAVDAAPGSADRNRRVRLTSARQWQPALVAFRNDLMMFWGQDRGRAGSALMMSTLEPGTGQWRSSELHFRPNGVPVFTSASSEERDGAEPGDPPFLTIEASPALTKRASILGLESLPQTLRISNRIAPAHRAGDPTGAADPSDLRNLLGQRLLPSPQYATVLTDKEGGHLLAVTVILQQVDGDWNNEAVKVPAVLTTRDMVSWQLSIVPLASGGRDFLGDPRGDVGWVSAWEPSVTMDAAGKVEMLFRLNLAPREAGGQAPSSKGYRMARSTGVLLPTGGVAWSVPRMVDIDVPTSRGQVLRRGTLDRWVMIHNNNVQGTAYRAGDSPVFASEKYEPWARSNLSVFFSTRGTEDYTAGLNLSAQTETPGVELVHYPYAQSVTRPNGSDEILLAYSTHRRTPACALRKIGADSQTCHDSIQFVRLSGLPDPSGAFIYPNQFAKHFDYGKSGRQEKTYGLHEGHLTLFNRASAGIDTFGTAGCVAMRFKLESELPRSVSRPVISFGRSADRSRALGLSVERDDRQNFLALAGRRLPLNFAPGQWRTTSVCYDLEKNTLTAEGVTINVDEALVPRAYLGDSTLKRLDGKLPDITFDLAGMFFAGASSAAKAEPAVPAVRP